MLRWITGALVVIVAILGLRVYSLTETVSGLQAQVKHDTRSIELLTLAVSLAPQPELTGFAKQLQNTCTGNCGSWFIVGMDGGSYIIAIPRDPTLNCAPLTVPAGWSVSSDNFGTQRTAWPQQYCGDKLSIVPYN